MPDVYMIIALKIFFPFLEGGGVRAPCPPPSLPSPTPTEVGRKVKRLCPSIPSKIWCYVYNDEKTVCVFVCV